MVLGIDNRFSTKRFVSSRQLLKKQFINMTQRSSAQVVSFQSVHDQFLGFIVYNIHLTPAGTLCHSESPITAVDVQA